MKKHKSSSGWKFLIILTGLVVMAVLVVGVIWSVWLKQTDTIVIQAPPAQRMKVPPMPEAQRTKVPPAPPRTDSTQPPTEPAQAQDTLTPQTSTVMSDPPPPREGNEPAAIPAPRIEEEIPDAAALEKAPASYSTADDAPAPEKSAVAQSVQKSSETPPPGAPSQETPQPATATVTMTERFNLQVGAYRVEANAQGAVAKLSKKGYAPFILEITDARQRTWYTVRIGRYENRESAAESLEKIKRNENIAAVIVKTGNF